MISENGTLLSSRADTMYYPKDRYHIDSIYINSAKGNMWITEQDTILVSYSYKYYDREIELYATDPDLWNIQLYDKSFNKIGRINTGKLLEMFDDAYDIKIRHADADYMTLNIIRTNTFNRVVVDYDMNVLSNVAYNHKNDETSYASGVLSYSKIPYMITTNWKPAEPHHVPQILRYYLHEDGEWVLKYTHNMGGNHYIDEIKYLKETPENDIIMCVDHAYYHEDLGHSTCETDLWMLLDGSKIGLKTSTTEVVNTRIIALYPNPTADKVHFQTEDAFHLEVYDVTGKRLDSKMIEAGNSYDVSGHSQGIYFFHMHDEKGRLLGVEKVVRK